jgi:hypothetical protein
MEAKQMKTYTHLCVIVLWSLSALPSFGYCTAFGQTDIDCDGLPDSWESSKFGSLVFDADDDPDSDALDNMGEYLAGTHPWNSDCDSDGVTDGQEVYSGWSPAMNPLNVDTDGDGLGDLTEYNAVYGGTGPGNWDSDGDGISDGDEVFTHSSSPTSNDSDGDYLPDGWELTYFGTPFAGGTFDDPDSDLRHNLDEYQQGKDPLVAD